VDALQVDAGHLQQEQGFRHAERGCITTTLLVQGGLLLLVLLVVG
jgi:hypothetical protein